MRHVTVVKITDTRPFPFSKEVFHATRTSLAPAHSAADRLPRLDAIPAAPPQTAATWLTIQPVTAIQIGALEMILVQPSTTFFVYLLGVLAVGAGFHFFRIRDGQQSRIWWG